MEFAPCSVQTLLADSIAPFRVEARDRGVSLTIAATDDVSDVCVDVSRIQYAFANLLSNALRFTRPGGSIRVTAGVVNHSVRFDVCDSGGGIPREHLPKIFSMFFRVPGQADNNGAGLGLAIVREIVIAHGGEVGVDSEPGVGSTFWFTLPQVVPAMPPRESEP